MVFVLNRDGSPLNPCSPARARHLLKEKKVRVKRSKPLVLQMVGQIQDPVTQPHSIKIDPGSRHTGMALVREDGVVAFGLVIHHKTSIKDKMDDRRGQRRGRRRRIKKHREARFNNRKPLHRRNRSDRPEGRKDEPQVYQPTHESRMSNIITWVRRLRRWAPVEQTIYYEDVKFDIQLINNPQITTLGYQQGLLYKREVREYLLYVFGPRCVYGSTPKGWSKKSRPKFDEWVKDPKCAKAKGLEIEHIRPRSDKGTNKPSNLTLACPYHNQEKDSLSLEEYGRKVGKDFSWVKKLAGTKLHDHDRDASWMNIVRKEIPARLEREGFNVWCFSGGQTSYNRRRNGLPKRHWVDAACVGPFQGIKIKGVVPLEVTARGHGSRQSAGNLGKTTEGDPITNALGVVSRMEDDQGNRLYPTIPPLKARKVGVKRRDIVRRVRRSLKRIAEQMGKVKRTPAQVKYLVTPDLFDAIMADAQIAKKRRPGVKAALERAFEKEANSKGVWAFRDIAWIKYHQWIRKGRPKGKVPGHKMFKDACHDFQSGDIVYGRVPETATRNKWAGQPFKGRLAGVQYQTNKGFDVVDSKGKFSVWLEWIEGRAHTLDGYVYGFGAEEKVNWEARMSFLKQHQPKKKRKKKTQGASKILAS